LKGMGNIQQLIIPGGRPSSLASYAKDERATYRSLSIFQPCHLEEASQPGSAVTTVTWQGSHEVTLWSTRRLIRENTFVVVQNRINTLQNICCQTRAIKIEKHESFPTRRGDVIICGNKIYKAISQNKQSHNVHRYF
jgi:hypothetical protein